MPTKMPDEEFRDLSNLLIDLGREDLTEWEEEFVDSLLRRVETYKDRIFVSDKQWETLEKLREEYL